MYRGVLTVVSLTQLDHWSAVGEWQNGAKWRDFFGVFFWGEPQMKANKKHLRINAVFWFLQSNMLLVRSTPLAVCRFMQTAESNTLFVRSSFPHASSGNPRELVWQAVLRGIPHRACTEQCRRMAVSSMNGNLSRLRFGA